jgi:hypothetical protein
VEDLAEIVAEEAAEEVSVETAEEEAAEEVSVEVVELLEEEEEASEAVLEDHQKSLSSPMNDSLEFSFSEEKTMLC